jgi:hypothetical protein
LVRGALCDGCNKALGLLEEDARVIASAAEYLADPPIKPGWRYSRPPLDEMLRLFGAQALCAICAVRTGIEKLKLDHDHRTQWIRGLLCRNCNVAIGQLGDDPRRANALLSYLHRCEVLFETAGRTAERRDALLAGVKKTTAVGVLEGLDEYVLRRWDLPLGFESPRLPAVPRRFPQNLTELAHSFLEQLDIRPGILWAGLNPNDILDPATGVSLQLVGRKRDVQPCRP